MNQIVATLPYPPSVNHYWVLGRGHLYVSPDGRQYRRRVSAILTGAPQMVGPVAVAIEVHPPDRRRRDLDNLLKCLLDSLTNAGLWADDSQVESLSIARGETKSAGSVLVAIEPMGGLPC
jgi:crossover junction endodeoxyribonuclease RusA